MCTCVSLCDFSSECVCLWVTFPLGDEVFLFLCLPLCAPLCSSFSVRLCDCVCDLLQFLLHTYLAVPDIEAISIKGLQGTKYMDGLRDRQVFPEVHSPMAADVPARC